MSNSTNATGPLPDMGPMLTALDVFLQVRQFGAGLAFAVATLSPVCILLSSKHFYTGAVVGRLPFVAGVAWFVAAALNNAAAAYTSFGSRYCAASVAAWVFDCAARSMLVWFSSMRLRDVWASAGWAIWICAAILQVLQIVAMGLIIAASVPGGGGLDGSQRLTRGFLALDGIAAVLDVALLVRVAVVAFGRGTVGSASMRRPSTSDSRAGSNSMHGRASEVSAARRLPSGAVSAIQLAKALLCIASVAGLHLAASGLAGSEADEYWVFYSVLFAFRILLADVSSNAVREVLGEEGGRSTSGEAETAIKTAGDGGGTASRGVPLRSGQLEGRPSEAD
ncbi:hypothetical protein HK105_204406 [Polyrhizophydium stewartii]|uniref:Uncharacterized protein n=1 Tax=Polyrhizophydium stewartii TaxID=2732419 RepID=A0ABR4N8X4_9FUNG